MRKRLSMGMAGVMTAALLAVGASPTPVAASGNEGWSALGSGTQGIDNRVFQIAKANDGSLYVGGTFTSAGGVTGTSRIARFDPATSTWNALGAGANGGVYAVAYDPVANHVWIGGGFSTVNNSNQNRLARWNASTSAWITPTPTVETVPDGVEEITVVASNQVYIGGAFTVSGVSAARGLAMFNGTNLVAVGGGLANTSDGSRIVNGMARADNGVIIGGQFTQVSGSATNRVAQWDGSSWTRFTTGPGNGLVAAVASTSAGIFIGGNFDDFGAVTDTKRLAMWNGSAWVSLGAVEGAVVEELQVIGNYLYAGGVFTSIGGVTANNIARYNLSTQTWEALTDLCFNGVNGVVRTIVDAGNGAVYVGGGFTAAGGVGAANGIAKFSPSTRGCPTSSPQRDIPAPGNFRVTGVTPDRVGRINGMQVHLAWDAPAGSGYRLFNVTTRGRFNAGEFVETSSHENQSCWTVDATCTIFYPFTSNDRSMAGRQYHQVIYTLQGYSADGAGLTTSVGPLADLEPMPPSAPLNVRAQAGWNNVTVTWDAPTSSGSAGFVTNYLVRSSRGNVCITRVTTIPETADARRCTFTNLRPGTRYTFTVQALSTFGWGANSEASSNVTPYFLRTVDSKRQGPWLSLLFGSRTTWTGEAPGYAPGTPVTAFYRIGTGRWERDSNARVRVDAEGRFTYRRDFAVLYNRRTISVRFSIGNPATCTTAGPPCGESAVSTLGSAGR